MASRLRHEELGKKRRKPATTPDARENQLISMAYDEVERRIRTGEASSQEITHFLKLGSSRERIEQERMAHEVELLKVRREAVESARRVEELYTEAMSAMSSYQGNKVESKTMEDD